MLYYYLRIGNERFVFHKDGFEIIVWKGKLHNKKQKPMDQGIQRTRPVSQ